MAQLILQLALAHIIGDFVIQPDRWLKDKDEENYKPKYLYAHIAVHALALIFILQFELVFWKGILIILSTHYLFDLIKMKLLGRFDKRVLFFLDQIAHALVIAVVVHMYEPFEVDFTVLYSSKVLLFVAAILTCTVVASKLMKVIITTWDLSDEKDDGSLARAGKYIGILERLFVFGFLASGHWQAIGFLLAAKSIFRFGDLTRPRDRKLTEYILIGTLLSFSFAILVGLLYVYGSKLIAG